MIRALLVLLFTVCLPAAAEVARVEGGEHPDFTRIVVQAAEAGDWRFGRSVDGYELALSAGVTGFDLSAAFDKIPKDRISGLWRDPVTGRLRMALSCSCHAIAFEFRPGIIVVDIKSGPPPEGSSFELPLDQPADPSAKDDAEKEGHEKTEGYDWLAIWRDSDLDKGPSLPATGPQVSSGATERAASVTDPFRDALLAQISRGAAEGVVEIAERPKLPAAADDPVMEAEGIRAGLGDLPGIVIAGPGEPIDKVAANGERCLPDEFFAIGDWRPKGKVAEVIGLTRSGLLEEFDVPATDAILRATRTYVAFGFGAEARQILELLPGGGDPKDVEISSVLRTLSYVVDLDADPESALAGMQSCDGAVALWSVLAELAAGRPVQLTDVNTDALRRAFSGLPADFRRYFSSTLVDLALRSEDQELARALRDAATRAPGEVGPDLGLVDARVELASGESEVARTKAEEVMLEAGPLTAEAAVVLVDAAFEGGQSIPEDLPELLAAFLRDNGGQQIEPKLRRAIVLANAMAGDFDAAFLELDSSPDTARDLWSVAANGAQDETFIEQAILAVTEEGRRKDVDLDTSAGVAERLLSFGFAKEALVWLGEISASSPASRKTLAGRAHLALQDARAALSAVTGLDGEDAEIIRAEAVLQLGDPKNAAMFFELGGDSEAGQRAVVWTQDWDAVATDGPDLWKAAAEVLVKDSGPNPPSEAVRPAGDPGLPLDPEESTSRSSITETRGPLARGQELVEESMEARRAIEALLENVSGSQDQ